MPRLTSRACSAACLAGALYGLLIVHLVHPDNVPRHGVAYPAGSAPGAAMARVAIAQLEESTDDRILARFELLPLPPEYWRAYRVEQFTGLAGVHLKAHAAHLAGAVYPCAAAARQGGMSVACVDAIMAAPGAAADTPLAATIRTLQAQHMAQRLAEQVRGPVWLLLQVVGMFGTALIAAVLTEILFPGRAPQHPAETYS